MGHCQWRAYSADEAYTHICCDTSTILIGSRLSLFSAPISVLCAHKTKGTDICDQGTHRLHYAGAEIETKHVVVGAGSTTPCEPHTNMLASLNANPRTPQSAKTKSTTSGNPGFFDLSINTCKMMNMDVVEFVISVVFN